MGSRRHELDLESTRGGGAWAFKSLEKGHSNLCSLQLSLKINIFGPKGGGGWSATIGLKNKMISPVQK
jgi:hypothetical protein